MSVYPLTEVLHGENKAVVVSGPFVQVLDSKSGELLSSTANLEGEARESVVKSGPVRCAAVDTAYQHLATAADDKHLKVWAVDGLQLLSTRELPKKPTQIAFTRDGKTIVVADKFGDVFSYPLVPEPVPEPSPDSKNDTLASHENPSGGRLILGHTSLLTSFSLSEDEKYIVTADRDEHIRVSWYPHGYCIENYCLGHQKFVSSIHIPSFAPHILISGGGDPSLKIWDWRAGKSLCDIPISDTVTPYIKVRPKRRRWGDEDHEGADEGEGNGKKRGRRGRAKTKKKGQDGQAASAEPDAQDDEGMDEDAPVVEDLSETTTPVPEAVAHEESSEALEPVHVLGKLDSFSTGGHHIIVFNAVGATALFWCSSPSLSGQDLPVVVHAHDFGLPVITFVRHAGVEGRILVVLDAQWSAEGGEVASDKPQEAIKVLQLTADSAEEADLSPLVSTINTQCRPAATTSDLKALDIYSHLSSMPKNAHASHNPMLRDSAAPEIAAQQGKSRRGQPRGDRTSAKAKGKMKTRMALLQNAQQTSEEQRASEEREVKRPRSEAGGELESEGQGDTPDVVMDAP
ncbi:WD40 repeat-like protein [Artomyces pyxidatus]|uniref:WD40 repeat-like protein n=1 Tax=Artomyces pyxidatus TaxID=48021 RepID=A0ACB8SXS6_9AGAM|nr:WD40 repeat-like protein [Artomyces pyxidatus]